MKITLFSSKVIIALAVLLVVVLVSVFMNANTPTGAVTKDPAELAKCLTSKGVKMYGTSWCPHCNNQKTIFGDSFKYVDYIECTEQQEECTNAGVEGYPTWIIDGKKYPGEQSLDQLRSLSGC